ncbi:hypothetical protein [Pseudescherichia sp.]|uniref:hypothetical protein n=1 Tax=Pseudescherichia sp. TaxID=2055881 RepID=UPI0028A88255|nr:hypothetical protein [Pseudescherichia sp.]
MNIGFTVNGIEVPAEYDKRHINEYIDAGHPDVKQYIENIEDDLDAAYAWLLEYEPENEFLLQQIELNKERNERTRK